MKITSNEKISTIISLIFTLIVGFLLSISHYNDFSDYYLFIIFAMLSNFLVMYIVLYYFLNNFIIKKIEPLFKTIDTLKMPIDKLYESIEGGYLLEEVDSKVLEWARSKIDEIAVLKANEQYRKEFLGNVSHELKTPLFNIQGYILTLIDSKLEDENINMKYLKRTSKNINRLISIVQDLETISRLETKQHLLEIEKFNVIKLIDEIVDMQEIRANRKKITLKYNKEYTEPIYVKADKKKISTVISNLVINSVIYGRENGMTEIIIEQKFDKVYISIKDNGIGIAEKYQKRIFERFFRVDKSRSKIQGGTGLGLSIVKHSIEAHKQSISVSSQLDKGSTFTFTLEKA